VTVANFREQKAYPQLIDVAQVVTERNPQVTFLFVGYGPLEAEMRARTERMGLSGRVRFLGHRADVTRLLAASDIFALASHFEGGPLAVMEAMAAGLPVVATSVGFVPDVIADGIEGLVVPPREPHLLAARIEELVADPGRRAKLGAAAAARSASFDVRVAVRRIEETYADLLRAK
jgi:glycosyltransferase involved in cell wall biosynthesis